MVVRVAIPFRRIKRLAIGSRADERWMDFPSNVVMVRGARVRCVDKVRGSQHSKDLREYEIDADAKMVVGEPFRGYEGLLTGSPFDANRGVDRRDSDSK